MTDEAPRPARRFLHVCYTCADTVPVTKFFVDGLALNQKWPSQKSNLQTLTGLSYPAIERELVALGEIIDSLADLGWTVEPLKLFSGQLTLRAQRDEERLILRYQTTARELSRLAMRILRCMAARWR